MIRDSMESNFDSDSLPNTVVILHEDTSHDPDDNLDEIIHSPSGEQNKENVKETPVRPAKTIRFDTQDAADLGEARSETVTKWSQWKPASLRSRKHPALCKPKPKRPFEKVADAKMQILEEEYKNKKNQWAFEEEEREYKREMWALEKKLLLKKLNEFNE